jgi:hypothetical protein
MNQIELTKSTYGHYLSLGQLDMTAKENLSLVKFTKQRDKIPKLATLL